MTPSAAMGLAAGCLGWMAEEPERLAAFMTATGIGPDTLRARHDTPEVALAILDHLMADEGLLIAACQALGLSPETPARAQIALGGGPGPNWT